MLAWYFVYRAAPAALRPVAPAGDAAWPAEMCQ
jgi:hypothetical protein